MREYFQTCGWHPSHMRCINLLLRWPNATTTSDFLSTLSWRWHWLLQQQGVGCVNNMLASLPLFVKTCMLNQIEVIQLQTYDWKVFSQNINIQTKFKRSKTISDCYTKASTEFSTNFTTMRHLQSGKHKKSLFNF